MVIARTIKDMLDFKTCNKKSYFKNLLIIISLLVVSCNPSSLKEDEVKSQNEEYKLADFKRLLPLHKKLQKAKQGEWLYSYKEKGQSVKKYIKSSPVTPSHSQNKIYIQPIGNFTTFEDSIIKITAEFVDAFYGLEVLIIETITDKIIPNNARRIHFGTEQLHTKYILDSVLLKKIPDDAIIFSAVTNKDLYPQESWNFVFGQAYLKKRTGVSSFFRFKYENLNMSNKKLFLKRIMETTVHEMGHMFSIKHCIKYKCIMNGSNSLNEADSKPLWLCPECLAKVCWCLDYEVLERFHNLKHFFKKYGFNSETQFCEKSQTAIRKL